MPWKDPNFVIPEVITMILAAVTAVIRVIYDKEETKWGRIVLEAAFCSFLAWSLYAAAKTAGMQVSSDWAIVIGCWTGILGSEFIRSLARNLIKKRTKQ